MFNNFGDVIQLIRSLSTRLDSLLRNSIFVLIANLLGTALGFLFWVVAANYYSVSVIGKVGALISAVGILSSVGSIGIDYSLLKYLPTDVDRNSLVTSSILVVIAFSALLSILYLFAAVRYQDLPSVAGLTWVIIFIVTTPCLSIFNLFHKSIFISFQKSSYSIILAGVSYLRLFLAPLLIGAGSVGLFSSYSTSVLIASLFGVLLTYTKLIENPPTLNQIPKTKKLVTYSFGNYLADIFDRGIIYGVPLVAIPILGATDGGYFYIAWQIGLIFLTIPKMLMKPLLSEGSRKFTETKELVVKATVLVIGIQIIGVLLFAIFGNVILSTFGQSYSTQSYQVVLVVSGGGVIYSFNILYTTVKRINGNLRSVIWYHGQIAVVTLVLTFVLGDLVGQTGVGLAWIFANLITLLTITSRFVQRYGEIDHYFQKTSQSK